jgi:hypothetical protein
MITGCRGPELRSRSDDPSHACDIDECNGRIGWGLNQDSADLLALHASFDLLRHIRSRNTSTEADRFNPEPRQDVVEQIL